MIAVIETYFASIRVRDSSGNPFCDPDNYRENKKIGTDSTTLRSFCVVG